MRAPSRNRCIAGNSKPLERKKGRRRALCVAHNFFINMRIRGERDHAENRLPPVQRKGIPGHGPGGCAHRRQHLPILHAQPARRQGQAPGRGGHRGLPRLCAGVGPAPDPRPRALHAQRLRRGRGAAHLCPRDHGRRPRPARAHPRQLLQLPSGQPCAPGRGGGRRAHRGAPERDPAARAVHHRAPGDHGGQGIGGRRQLCGAARHPRPRAPGGKARRLPGHLPRP